MRCLYVTNIEHTIYLFFTPHIKMLTEMGIDVTVLTSVENEEKLKETLPGVTFQHIPFTRSVKSLTNIKVYRLLKQLFKREKYDFIHVHTPIAAFLTRLAAPKEQVIIYTAHGFHFHHNGSRLTNLMYYMAEKMVASKTTRVIVMNEEDRRNAVKLFPVNEIQLIYGVGVDAQYYCSKEYTHLVKKKLKDSLNIPHEAKVITQIADVNDNKRQKDIILAAEMLKKHIQNFVILLVGNGPLLEHIKTQIVKRGLEKNVVCLGYRDDIRDILSITDVGLLVSLREGLPKSVMEMMAMEIPVVATNIRGNQDLIVDGKNGFLIPTKNPFELKRAIHTLIQNDTLQKQMGREARKIILAKYDLKNILQETGKVYEHFMADRV